MPSNTYSHPAAKVEQLTNFSFERMIKMKPVLKIPLTICLIIGLILGLLIFWGYQKLNEMHLDGIVVSYPKQNTPCFNEQKSNENTQAENGTINESNPVNQETNPATEEATITNDSNNQTNKNTPIATDNNHSSNEVTPTNTDNEDGNNKVTTSTNNNTSSNTATQIPDKNEESIDYYQTIQNSKRVNILCLGIADYSLADTIVVISFDPTNKLVDLISIPRDTYFHRAGYDSDGQRKVNASFAISSNNLEEKAQSAMDAICELLQIPIHHFVKVDYEGVEKTIDCLGGIEVDIPFNMDYDDKVDDLHIHFKKGKQLLNGVDSIKYLRFRKNNDGSYSDGDIGRIKRQQDFMIKAIKKSLSLNFLNVINTATSYVKTSMKPNDIIFYANQAAKIKGENIKTYTLPGKSEYRKYTNNTSYWIYDEDASKKMILKIYK